MTEYNYPDFVKDADLSIDNWLPPEIEDKSTSFITLQKGQYLAIFGRLHPVYRDAAGKLSDEVSPGSSLGFIRHDLFLVSYLGDGLNKTGRLDYLTVGLNPKDNVTVHKILFRDFITIDPKQQWKNKNKYVEFIPPLYVEEEKRKSTILKNFIAHYGRLVSLSVDLSKKGNGFIRTIVSTEKIYPSDLMEKLELWVSEEITKSKKPKSSEEPPSLDELNQEWA